VPPGTVFEPGSPLFNLVAATIFNPANQLAFVQWVQAAGLPFVDPQELAASALYVLGFQLRYTNDFVDRVNGKVPYDNTSTEYAVAPTQDPATNAYLSAALNAGVERFVADQAAVNYYERNDEPTGDIRIPVVTLHTTRDPAVPFWHEALYASRVADAGRSEWLTQRSVSAWGHCAFQPSDMIGAFTELVAKASR
jgi:hypothetical protein